ncbi:hypothetical protein [Sphaerisporangium fuscum]|uniref:hypothetical protein n=1 Tax=Sphaerisporangium fuscum TaxID=2835868 RepID=UPI001BDD5D8A|nr:hypothetical protein [Sphaerisporangium fuscum]
MPRKPRGHERRAAYFSQQIAAAADGAQALDAAWNWLTAALARLDIQDPAKADRARRSLAEQLAGFARDADPKTAPRR